MVPSRKALKNASISVRRSTANSQSLGAKERSSRSICDIVGVSLMTRALLLQTSGSDLLFRPVPLSAGSLARPLLPSSPVPQTHWRPPATVPRRHFHCADNAQKKARRSHHPHHLPRGPASVFVSCNNRPHRTPADQSRSLVSLLYATTSPGWHAAR